MGACQTQWHFRFMPCESSGWRDCCQSLRVTGARAETSQHRPEILEEGLQVLELPQERLVC